MSYRNINSVTRSLISLLDSHLASDPTLQPFFDPGLGGSLAVNARTPEEMETANQNGLSVWLYQIQRDPELLNMAPRRTAYDRMAPHMLPLRLHYLMTPVVNSDDNAGNDPGLEQFIIGKVLQTFLDHPQLSGPDLLGDLAGTDSTVGVRLEPLGLEEITRVWDALGATYQLCISYEVSFALIGSDAPDTTVIPVDTVEVISGQLDRQAIP